LGALIGEVAGEAIATSNAHEKVKTLRGILGDSLAGINGRTKAEPWAPRWLHFPATTYLASNDRDAEIGEEDDLSSAADAAPCVDDESVAYDERDIEHDEATQFV